jgi:hypothetical protein
MRLKKIFYEGLSMQTDEGSTYETITDYETLFRIFEETVRSVITFDGIALTVFDMSTNRYISMGKDGLWREFEVLPESLTQNAFFKDGIKRYEQPSEKKGFFPAVDTQDETHISSLLLYTFEDSNNELKCVVSLWTCYEEEKDQILQPLVVGNQMVGMTTRIKNKVKHKTFDIEEIKQLKSYAVTQKLKSMVHRLYEIVTEKKEVLLKTDKKNDNTDEIFTTPQELITTLLNILLGTRGTIENMSVIVKRLEKLLRSDGEALKQVKYLASSLDGIKNNLLHAFRFASAHEIVASLTQTYETVETERFFKNLLENKLNVACEKHIVFNYFHDPRIGKKAAFADRTNLYTFLSQFLDFLFAISAEYSDMEFQVLKQSKNEYLIVKAVFRTKNEIAASDVENLFFTGKQALFNEFFDETSYKRFKQIGGKTKISYDKARENFVIQVAVPYKPVDTESSGKNMHSLLENKKVGFLLSSRTDMSVAENMARYLILSGVAKENIFLIKDSRKIVEKALTHIVVFEKALLALSESEQSIFSDRMVMLVTEGCLRDGEMPFYNYAFIDMEIEKNDIYLSDLEEFISLEAFEA